MTTGADWLDTARRVVDAFLTPTSAPAPEAPAEEGSGHADSCRWCPVCQAMAVARGERPEVSATLADLFTTTAAALRTFAESGLAPAQQAAADGDTAAERPSAPSAPATTPTADGREENPKPTGTVQRIVIA